MENERIINISATIKTTAFISYIIGFIAFMWMLEGDDLQRFKLILIGWLLFWGLITILSLKKESLVSMGFSLAKILMSKELTNDEKVGLIMEFVRSWTGIAADLSQIVHLEKKEKNDPEIDFTDI